MDMMLKKFRKSMESQGEIYSDGGKTDVKEKKEEEDQLIFKWKGCSMKKLAKGRSTVKKKFERPLSK